MSLLRSVLCVLAASAAILAASPALQAQTVMRGEAANIKSLGTIEVRSIPRPVEREKFRVIRAPLPKPAVENEPVGVPDGPASLSADPLSTAPQSAASLVQSFEGIEASGLEPPDPHLAVGTQDLILATNAALRVYAKDGTPLTGLIDPSTFFGVPASFEIQSDPKVLFDAASGRYFGVWIGFDGQTRNGALFVAVSNTSSATGSFTRYQITEAGNLPDYPGLGICGDKLVLTANDFRRRLLSFTYNGAIAIAINKAQLVSGSSSIATNRFGNIQLNSGGRAFTVQPVHSLTATNTCNLVTLNSTNTGIQLYKINGLPPNATFAAVPTVPALNSAVSAPSGSVQPGTTTLVANGDDRLLDATYRDVNGGSIWTASNTRCQFPGASTNLTCINLVELANVNTTPTLRQQIVFGAPGSYFYYPALRTDINNNMSVVFTQSSSNDFPSVRFSSHLNSAALGSIEPSTLVVAGTAPYTATRWGDYFGAALDPSDPTTIWLYGQYKRTGSSLWYTHVAKTRIP